MGAIRSCAIKVARAAAKKRKLCRSTAPSWLDMADALGFTGDRSLRNPMRVWVIQQLGVEDEALRVVRSSTAKAKATRDAKPVTGSPTPRKLTYQEANADAFLASYEWRRVRMQALKKHGARCQCCGATPADGVKMNVDHIKPRKLFPELALSLSNLQVLCEVCNHGKGNWDMTDWRQNLTPSEEVNAEALAHFRGL